MTPLKALYSLTCGLVYAEPLAFAGGVGEFEGDFPGAFDWPDCFEVFRFRRGRRVEEKQLVTEAFGFALVPSDVAG